MSSSYTLHSRVVDPSDLVTTTNALAQSQRDLTVDDVEDLSELPTPDVRALLNIGKEIQLIEQEDSRYTASSDIALQFRQANQNDERKKLLRMQLQKYRPFITFIKNLIDGSEPGDAARQVGVFYQLGPDEDVIENQFLELGEYCGILNRDSEGIEYNFNTEIISRSYFQGVAEMLEDELVARIFLDNRLDEDIVVYMDQESFNQLVAALRNFGSDPSDAISAAGRAIETFQRNLGNDYGSGSVDFTTQSGIRELAQALNSDGLIKDRHRLAAEYLGEVRNKSGAHGIDPTTDERWITNEEVAYSNILTGIHYIRSVYAWVVDDQLII